MATPDKIKINGVYHDWSSVTVKVRGQIIQGIQAISYGNVRKLEMVDGQGAQSIGRTRGKQEANCSMDILLDPYYELIHALAGAAGSRTGYMEVPFDIVVQYQEADFPIRTDTIPGCVITEDPSDQQTGGKALMFKLKLSAMYVVRDGLLPLNDMRR